MCKSFKSLCLLLTVSIIAVCFFSCTKLPDIELYRDTFIELTEAAFEVNDLLFGAGLQVDEVLSADEDYAYSGYKYVADDAKYRTIGEIKSAAEKVYSSNYLDYIYGVIFTGYADTSAGVVSARFIENQGMLMQSDKAHPLNGTRRFDYSTMKAVRPCSASMINIEITSWIEGGTPLDVDGANEINEILSGKKHTYNLRFVLEDGKWYLDKPTY